MYLLTIDKIDKTNLQYRWLTRHEFYEYKMKENNDFNLIENKTHEFQFQ